MLRNNPSLAFGRFASDTEFVKCVKIGSVEKAFVKRDAVGLA